MPSLELLAPAKDLATAKAAVDHGADAVYIGAARFGARAAAGNSTDDIAQLCQYAHAYGVKVYVTVNTIVYDHELDDTRRLLEQLIQARVDAILVQDMAVPQLLREAFNNVMQQSSDDMAKTDGTPPLRMPQLHASTQTDNRTPEKVAWLHSLGFTRVVLARELSVEEISAIHQAVPEVELEAFVHGALCVSYSGACYASQFCQQRSANRGECAQMCRMRYTLTDADNRTLQRQRYLLSLKDMCRLPYLEEMAEAGVCSFKIEGRLKDIPYVKNVTAAYSLELDRLVDSQPQRYRRNSWGHCRYTFTPDVQRSFNRGFTTYGLHGREADVCNPLTPKAMGQPVGTVRQVRQQWFSVSAPTTITFANGDGLCFIDDDGQLVGFRVNRAEGLRLYPQHFPQGLRQGVRLYRNQDEAFNKLLAGKTAERKIDVTMLLTPTAEGYLLTMQTVAPAGRTCTHLTVTATLTAPHQQAEKDQRENMVRQLTRLGGTPYECQQVELSACESHFIPASLLADLRRQAVAAMTAAALQENNTPPLDISDNENRHKAPVPAEACDYTLNIANRLARQFYEQQGVEAPQPAFEIEQPEGRKLLMQCRHCLRYMLGRCVKNGGKAPEWKEPLFLTLDNGQRFQLEFDCRHCQMNVVL